MVDLFHKTSTKPNPYYVRTNNYERHYNISLYYKTGSVRRADTVFRLQKKNDRTSQISGAVA